MENLLPENKYIRGIFLLKCQPILIFSANSETLSINQKTYTNTTSHSGKSYIDLLFGYNVLSFY